MWRTKLLVNKVKNKTQNHSLWLELKIGEDIYINNPMFTWIQDPVRACIPLMISYPWIQLLCAATDCRQAGERFQWAMVCCILEQNQNRMERDPVEIGGKTITSKRRKLRPQTNPGEVDTGVFFVFSGLFLVSIKANIAQLWTTLNGWQVSGKKKTVCWVKCVNVLYMGQKMNCPYC